MTDAAVAKIDSEDENTMDQDKFVRKVVLALAKDGVSEAKVASKGSWQGQEFQERGRALFDGKFGSALFESSGTHESQTFSFERLSRFDVDGFVAAEDASDKFAAEGSLYIKSDTIPEYLAADFSPKALEGWVADGCPDTETEISLNPESSEHKSCEGDRQDNHIDCWDQNSYESGSEVK